MRNSKVNTETEKEGGVEEERLGGIKRKKTTTIIDDEEIREGLTNDIIFDYRTEFLKSTLWVKNFPDKNKKTNKQLENGHRT